MAVTGQGSISKAEASSGRRYFYLTEWIRNTFLANIQIGIFLVLPLVVMIFSKLYAFSIIAIEIVSFCLGGIIKDFEMWYNRRDGEVKIAEGEEKILPRTELGDTLERIQYFERKYWITIKDMYIFLSKDTGFTPTIDNLDWIEMVSLLNKLSLNVGKHFEEETTEKGTEL
jgi:hypothetical protein